VISLGFKQFVPRCLVGEVFWLGGGGGNAWGPQSFALGGGGGGGIISPPFSCSPPTELLESRFSPVFCGENFYPMAM